MNEKNLNQNNNNFHGFIICSIFMKYKIFCIFRSLREMKSTKTRIFEKRKYNNFLLCVILFFNSLFNFHNSL
jgi:hypothetical protein